MEKKSEEFKPKPGFHMLDDYNELKWMTSTQFYFELPPGFKQYAQIKRWCEENCQDTVVFFDRIPFRREEALYFFNGEDAMACKLRWEE